MRKLGILSVILFLSTPCLAAYQWGFGDVSFNSLAWDQGTQDKSTKRNFNFLEIEGGAQFSWGELYGFYDSENIGKSSDETRTASKAMLRYYLGDSGFSIYAHTYAFSSFGFADQSRVLGVGYQLVGKTWSFKPFLGQHEVSQTYFSGANGMMGGWTLIYGFKAFMQNFMIIDWHELEFERSNSYAAANGGSKVSHNGAASIWWTPITEFSLGLQWRYATNKLGTPGSLNAAITSLKYNF